MTALICVVMTESLNPALARRIALAAQGFGEAMPSIVRANHLRRTIARLGLHQIDSVNVLTRAHYLPAYSRLGVYDPRLLEADAWGPLRSRRLFEYWAHEASLIPLPLQPLLRWRQAMADAGETGWKGLRIFARDRRADAISILERIRNDGPLAASDIESGKRRAGWWEWGDSKMALEWLFWSGHITTATRRASFERVYDLTERVLPQTILALPTPEPAAARRQLIEHSARALGVATAKDLRDYFRLSPTEAHPAIAQLVEEGVLQPVKIDGWNQSTWLHREARRPRRIRHAALLAPFDPLIWERDRAERLFGIRYRIEIYVPAPLRTYGYYVLPFLLDEQIVARVDLKADRKAKALLVQQKTFESDAPAHAGEELDEALRSMARWLGLDRVIFGDAVRGV
ncbi:winged helix-turn-helix domain-containing protein [Sphingobium sp. IP1]|nr:crosslink repair DNA glycosylase YcaQ family protein [Sphingobium sp. IP1]